jgi:hypothetical protein
MQGIEYKPFDDQDRARRRDQRLGAAHPVVV